jgi:membrane-bound metal-dependent hydrolase YbcI (DUF457 family)
MTFLSHILAGLIIGKITDNFTLAIIGSLIVDIDHLISFYRHGILFNIKKLIKETLDETDKWNDQRSFFHNIFVLIIISLIVMFFSLKSGLIILSAFFIHLVLDALNKTYLYPLYPIKKFAITGFIKYNSKQEIIFAAYLAVILVSLFIINF